MIGLDTNVPEVLQELRDDLARMKMRMTKVLLQAGSAKVAQANQLPQGVLALLR